MLKMGIITGFLLRTKDRFHEYNQPLDLDQKFKLMTQIEGYDGVEIVYPYEVSDPKTTRKILDKYKLNVAAVNVNVKAEPEFRNGGLTSHDKAVRDKAVRFIKEAKDFAASVGADRSEFAVVTFLEGVVQICGGVGLALVLDFLVSPDFDLAAVLEGKDIGGVLEVLFLDAELLQARGDAHVRG